VRDGWTVIPFVKLGCIPDFWTPANGKCGAWYSWAVRQASALHPDVTLIIGSWAGTKNPGKAIVGVAALSKAMKRSSARVMVLGDAPHQNLNPTDCLLSRGATMKTCTTTATHVDLRADIAIAASARKHGIGFIDTRGWFCAHPGSGATSYLCPLVINRTITCTDRGHIGQTYALELAQPFRVGFRRELFR
jgi:hypothetical protein